MVDLESEEFRLAMDDFLRQWIEIDPDEYEGIDECVNFLIERVEDYR